MKNILLTRFNEKDFKKRTYIWKTLIDSYFQKHIKKSDTVMDIGAGYCEFINNVSCRGKLAVDSSSIVSEFANKDVIKIVCRLQNIPKKHYGRVDIIFMSNFLEHLKTKDDVVSALKISNKLLTKKGKIIILQPNIDLMKERYWNRIDHHVALNGGSIIEALKISGFKIVYLKIKFLPSTIQLGLPMNKFLIKVYLSLPEVLRIFAGQSPFIAEKM